MSAATGGDSRTETSVLFGSNAPHQANFCRRLDHETGRWERPSLAAQARARAEECMSRRPSFASLDSGTYSPEYGGESLMAGRGELAAASLPNSPAAASDPAAPAGRRDTRHHDDGPLGAVWPGQPGCAAVRCNFRRVGNRSARRKMVCKGDPCIYAADGDPMTWLTSPLVVPCSGVRATEGARWPAPGLRHPGQLTDVHGREG